MKKRPYVLASLLTMVASSASGQTATGAARLAEIERECSLERGSLIAVGDRITYRPPQGEFSGHLDCAAYLLRKGGLGELGFVGNDYDPEALLPFSVRHVAMGSPAEVQVLTRALTKASWVVVRTAITSDGFHMVQFESAPNVKASQVDKLYARFRRKEFGDIALGSAPRKPGEAGPEGE